MKAQVNLVGDQRYLVSIVLQKEANAALVMTKQVSMLLPNACIKGAIKSKCCSFSTAFMLHWRQMH